MSHINSTNGAQRTLLASNNSSPTAFSVKTASRNPSNTEIAEAVYKRFGITRDDMPQLKKLFGGVDPIAHFARTLERNPRSTVTRDGVTATRISLSAQDYANLEKAGKTIRDAKGAPPANANQQPSSQPPSERLATKQGYNLAAHQRHALETELTTRQTTAAQQSSDNNREGVGAFLDGVVRGDFSGNDSWSATAGKIIGGLNPLADARDTVAAIKNVAQGKEGSGIGLVAAGIGWIPGVGDAGKALIKGGRKVAVEFAEEATERALKEGVQQTTTRTLKAVPEDVVTNALKNGFQTRRMQFGEHTFQLDQPGMKHILQRHHPEFWDGSIKNKQTFFDPKMSMDDIGDGVREVMQQNREMILRNGTNDRYQITGTYKGQEYTVGVNGGRIAQFYPVPK